MEAPASKLHDVPRDAPQAVTDAVFCVGTALDGLTAQSRRAFGLNAHERLALVALWKNGPMTMTEIGTWISLTRAAVTTLIDRMEATGLVRRTPDPDDGRQTIVHMVQGAAERIRGVLDAWTSDVGAIAAARTDGEWAIVLDFLRDVDAAAHRHAWQLAQLSDEEIQARLAPA